MHFFVHTTYICFGFQTGKSHFVLFFSQLPGIRWCHLIVDVVMSQLVNTSLDERLFVDDHEQ